MTSTPDLAQRIEIIERGYEYLLAYAAQGRQDDKGTEARATLQLIHGALDGLAKQAHAAFASGGDYDAATFLAALERDASTARGAVALVLNRPMISSLLVDNLNASVHLRALLTDVFLLEQAQK